MADAAQCCPMEGATGVYPERWLLGRKFITSLKDNKPSHVLVGRNRGYPSCHLFIWRFKFSGEIIKRMFTFIVFPWKPKVVVQGLNSPKLFNSTPEA